MERREKGREQYTEKMQYGNEREREEKKRLNYGSKRHRDERKNIERCRSDYD